MPALPPLECRRFFDAAARHESFVRAADELQVTAAAVAQPLHDSRPDLVVEGVPVVDVPAMHGFDPEPDLRRGRTLDAFTVVRDRVLCEVT